MTTKALLSGSEILDAYFEELATNKEIDEELRTAIAELWKQNQLYTKTHIQRALEELLEKKSK